MPTPPVRETTTDSNGAVRITETGGGKEPITYTRDEVLKDLSKPEQPQPSGKEGQTGKIG